MPKFSAPLIEFDKLPLALECGAIVTATRESNPGYNIDRYRMDVFLKEGGIARLKVSNYPGIKGDGMTDTIDAKYLHPKLIALGLNPAMLKELEPATLNNLHHLRGPNEETVCGKGFKLLTIKHSQLHTPDTFVQRPEHEQCPRCKISMFPNFQRVMRFRKSSEILG